MPTLLGILALASTATVADFTAYSPEPFSLSLIGSALLLLLIPSFGEELLFRGLLFPTENQAHRQLLVILSIAGFVLWHPLQHWSGIGPEWTDLFVEPVFLLLVVIAGVVLSILREVSGSLWPPILFHWLVVCGWKFFFGGPF